MVGAEVCLADFFFFFAFITHSIIPLIAFVLYYTRLVIPSVTNASRVLNGKPSCGASGCIARAHLEDYCEYMS